MGTTSQASANSRSRPPDGETGGEGRGGVGRRAHGGIRDWPAWSSARSPTGQVSCRRGCGRVGRLSLVTRITPLPVSPSGLLPVCSPACLPVCPSAWLPVWLSARISPSPSAKIMVPLVYLLYLVLFYRSAPRHQLSRIR